MSFEQYQFLRYYVPGSVFLIYMSLILLPVTNPESIVFLVRVQNLLALVTVVGGVFVASPPLGYLLYSLYDSLLYNRFAINWVKRRSLWHLLKFASIDLSSCPNLQQRIGAMEWSPHKAPRALGKEVKRVVCVRQLRAPLKSLIDFMIYCQPKDSELRVSKGGIAGNLRGYWSHFSARWICGCIAPILSAVASVAICSFYSTVFRRRFFLTIEWSLQDIHFVWLLLDVALIIFISFFLLVVAHRPKDEAFDLEYYVLKPMIPSLAASESFKPIWSYFCERVKEADKLE